MTRPSRPIPLTQDHRLRSMGSLGDFPVQATTLDVFRNVVAISRRFLLALGWCDSRCRECCGWGGTSGPASDLATQRR